MKLERIHEYIIPVVTTLAGMVFAVKMGSLTGQGSLGVMSVILLAVFCITLCIWLRTKTWILIVLTWDLTGWVPMTNLPLGVRDFAVLVVTGSFGIFYALKMLRVKTPVDQVDMLVGLLVLYLFTVYIRHPVGVNAFGAEKVGGRPYFDAAIAFLAYAILSRAPVDVQSMRRLPVYMLAATATTALLSLGSYLFPPLAIPLGQIYSQFAQLDTATQPADVTDRKQGLSLGCNTGLRLLCSYFRPTTLLLPVPYIGRFIVASALFAGVLLAGFRSSFITVALYGVVGSFFRHRVRDVIILAAAAGVFVTIMAVGNGRIFTLPLSVQRVLTIFPGNWDPISKADAEYSTKWRLDMWRIALTEDRYIHDRILGDGYGFTRSELAIMQSEMLGGTGFVGAAKQESFMVSGLFHSGPLSAMRYVGYVGLFIYTWLIVLMAARAWKLIRSVENTPYFPSALFVGMSIILLPLVFYAIAGAFQYNLPDTVYSAGLLKLIERGMRAPTDDGNQIIAKASGRDRLPQVQLVRPRARV